MDDDSMSDSSSRNSSVLEVLPTPEALKFAVSRSKLSWKNEKTCRKCQRELGMGLNRARKHFCKFCYHAVCSDCSPQKVMHPEDHEPLRICDTCLQKAFEEYYNEGYAQEIQRCVAEKEEIKQQIESEIQKKTRAFRESKELENAITDLELEAAAKAKEAEQTLQDYAEQKLKQEALLKQLKEQVAEEETAIGQLNESIRALEEQKTDLNKASIAEKDLCNQLKFQLAEEQDKNVKLVRTFEQASAKQKKTRKEEQLEAELQRLSKQEEEANAQTQTLEAERRSLEEAVENGQQELQQVKERLHSAPVLSSEDQARLTELRLQVQDQDYMLQKLRSKLSSQELT